MEARNEVFQTLKPVCVSLSQATLSFAGRRGSSADIIEGLHQLLRVLRTITLRQDAVNDKLADYIFFPLSHILRESQKLPVQALELCLQCLSILLRTGWRSRVTPNLGIQLLILLTFLADGKSLAQESQTTSEELQTIAFTCLGELFASITQTVEGRQALIDTANVPALGKAVAVMLDSIADGDSNDVQLTAVIALQLFCVTIPDRDALAISFLPGIVSTLTKVLTPSTKSRRSYKVLVGSLDVLIHVFKATLNDTRTKNLPEPSKAGQTDTGASPLTTSWLAATAAQVKLALANIFRLRQHDRAEVRQGLIRLCSVILEDCRISLSASAPMAAEALVNLCIGGRTDNATSVLQHLMTTDQSIVGLLENSLYQWVVSLPRVMDANDERAKAETIEKISLVFRSLSDQRASLTFLERTLALNLRDSVANIFRQSSATRAGVQSRTINISNALTGPPQSRPSTTFDLVLETRDGQEDISTRIGSLLQQISVSESSLSLARELVELTRMSTGEMQLASFWLSVNLTRSITEQSSIVEDVVDFGESPPGLRQELLDELYSISLQIVTDTASDTEVDSRLQALSMEVIALQATLQRLDFRGELVEALYPIVQLGGATSPALRNHAIVALNIIAQVCGYTHTADLIVSNVDYLVNAVALKLNSFDISPQAPQVLLLMIKLAGPSLLPYLDDLVSSIFTALESFHGYPKLVELLFSVLKGIAEEGVKAPLLAVMMGNNEQKSRLAYEPTTIEDAATVIRKIRATSKQTATEEQTCFVEGVEAFPQQPWKGNHSITEPSPQKTETHSEVSGSQVEEVKQQPEPEQSSPPAPKVHSLLLNISQLTQHYLPAASSSLRVSLLSLLITTFPALAAHEDSFLPLINTLWPVLVSRLDDSEAYIVAGTLDLIGSMCKLAGDFMRSRIEEVWGKVKEIYGHVSASTQSEPLSGAEISGITTITRSSTKGHAVVPAGPNRQIDPTPYYVAAPTRLIFEALLRLIESIADHVPIDEDIFEDVLDTLGPTLYSRDDIQTTLARRNPDTVWLALLKCKARYDLSHQTSIPIDSSIARPHGKQGWKFAEIVV